MLKNTGELGFTQLSIKPNPEFWTVDFIFHCSNLVRYDYSLFLIGEKDTTNLNLVYLHVQQSQITTF